MDEVADFGELFDFAESLVDLTRGQAQNRAVQIDVVASAEFRIKAGAELEQRRNTSGHRDRARGWQQNAGDHLQQRAFAGSVFANDTERLAGPDLEADVAQGPEVAMELVASRRDQLFEPVARGVVDGVTFGYALKFDVGHAFRFRSIPVYPIWIPTY